MPRIHHVSAVLLMPLVFGCARKTPSPAHPAASSTAHMGEAAALTPTPAPAAEAASPSDAAEGSPGALAIHFDYDADLLRPDALPVLEQLADTLRADQALELLIEGHCDEVGTTEYNLALGDRRAEAARNHLVRLGIPAARIRTISYGKERIRYPGDDPESHAKNRRDDLILGRQGGSPSPAALRR